MTYRLRIIPMDHIVNPVKRILCRSDRVRRGIVYLLMGVIAVGLLFQAYNIGFRVPFHDWDEAIYAQVTREFVQHPRLTLTYNGSTWFEKPPFVAWYYAVAWLIPLAPEITARMLSAVLGIVCVILLIRVARRLFSHDLAWIVPVAVCIQSPIFLDRSLLVNADIMLATAWLLYVYGSISQSSIALSIATITGTLSKSLLGLAPYAIDVVIMLATRTLRKNLKMFVILGVAGTWWYCVMIMMHGTPFLREHLIDHLVSRVVRPIELHFGGRMYYPLVLWRDSGFLAIIGGAGVLVAFVRHALALLKQHTGAGRHLLVYMLPVGYFALLTVSKAKLHWYVTPLIPFIALGAGSLVQMAVHMPSRVARALAYVGCAVIIVISLSRFVSSVLHIPPSWNTPTEKTRIAQCLQHALSVSTTSMSTGSVAYLVPPQQRTDAQVIEAARLQIGSSFRYGGNPALIYYLDRPVTLSYDVPSFIRVISRNHTTLGAIILDDNDLTDPLISSAVSPFAGDTRSPVCSIGSLRSYLRRD